MVIKKGLALAAALSCFALNAGATTVTLGVGSSTLPIVVQAGGILPPSVSFNDIFNFSLSTPGSFSYQVSRETVNFGFPNPSSPLGFSVVQLYGISASSFVSAVYDAASNTVVSNLNNLSAGAYYLKVSGTTTGLFGGQYLLNANLTALPIPEPETNLMMMLGLAAIGTLAYRKKNSV